MANHEGKYSLRVYIFDIQLYQLITLNEQITAENCNKILKYDELENANY